MKGIHYLVLLVLMLTREVGDRDGDDGDECEA